MADHPTLEPATAAAFADLVCADHELLRAERARINKASVPVLSRTVVVGRWAGSAGGRQRPTTPARPWVPRRQ
jgi:hypothetical protein